jgi:hypothetical protein
MVHCSEYSRYFCRCQSGKKRCTTSKDLKWEGWKERVVVSGK